MLPHIVYLHGFASSPKSSKANFFREALEKYGVSFHIPDLNVPDFEHLTLTAMLEKVAETINDLSDDRQVVVMGSSMGGLTALHFADRYQEAEASRVQSLILLAPAFDFAENRRRAMGDDWLEKWREAGALPYFNYAHDKEMFVHYGLAEDMLRFDSYSVAVDVPIIIYHGKSDETVDYQQSVRFAEKYSNTILHLLESDHQLLDQTDVILAGVIKHLRL